MHNATQKAARPSDGITLRKRFVDFAGRVPVERFASGTEHSLRRERRISLTIHGQGILGKNKDAERGGGGANSIRGGVRGRFLIASHPRCSTPIAWLVLVRAALVRNCGRRFEAPKQFNNPTACIAHVWVEPTPTWWKLQLRR